MPKTKFAPINIARFKAGLRSMNATRGFIEECKRHYSNCFHDFSRKKIQIENELAEMQRLIEFASREKTVEYDGPLKVFRIDDGETHWVVGADSDSALTDHVRMNSESNLGDYLSEYEPVIDELEGYRDLTIPNDDTGEIEIKTCAEWITGMTKSDLPMMLATTAY